MTQDENKRQYARAIKETRKKLGWTQKQLAKKIHTSQQAIARWENEVAEPRTENLQALSEALGVPLSHFIDRQTEIADDDFNALYRSLSSEDKFKTLEYMRLLKRHEMERSQFK